jgi:hypothetical protein
MYLRSKKYAKFIKISSEEIMTYEQQLKRLHEYATQTTFPSERGCSYSDTQAKLMKGYMESDTQFRYKAPIYEISQLGAFDIVR